MQSNISISHEGKCRWECPSAFKVALHSEFKMIPQPLSSLWILSVHHSVQSDTFNRILRSAHERELEERNFGLGSI
jgi:hypothetical protein